MSAKIRDKEPPYRPDKIEIKLDLTSDLGELEYTEQITYISKEEWEKTKNYTNKRISGYLKKKLPKGWSMSTEVGDRTYTVRIKASKLGVLGPIFSELGAFVSCDEAVQLMHFFLRSRDLMRELGR